MQTAARDGVNTMAALRPTSSSASRRGGLRARLLLSFMIPVVLLGAGAAVLIEVLGSRSGDLVSLSVPVARAILAGLVLLVAFVAAALALQVGDRFAGPVAWLVRAIDGGQLRLFNQLPPPATDWELGALCDRVHILLRQNIAGAQALEELEVLQEELSGVLDAGDQGSLDPQHWPRKQMTQPLTRRLLDSLRTRRERIQSATEGIARLQGLLEQDWREETLTIEELVRGSERCFIQHTQAAVEMVRLERLASQTPNNGMGLEVKGLLDDLRMGFQRWQQEVAEMGASSGSGQPPAEPPRMREWAAWVKESLDLLETSVTGSAGGADPRHDRLAAGLGKVSGVLTASGREISALSREAAQLERTWGRLGERLQTLMARLGEVEERARVMPVSDAKEAEGDASQ